MAQLQCMDVRLDTLFTELYQVNIRVGHIARRQVTVGGFAPKASPPPFPVASDSYFEDEDGDDDNDDDDGDATLSMRCLLDTLPFVTRDKKGK